MWQGARPPPSPAAEPGMKKSVAIAAAVSALFVATWGAPLPALAQVRAQSVQDAPFVVTPIVKLDEPWTMTFLPDGRLLVTEKKGRLRVVTTDGRVGNVTGVPEVDYGGQGGLGDVVLHPKFASNGLV